MQRSGRRIVFIIGVFASVSVAALLFMQQWATHQGAETGADSPRDLALRAELGRVLGSDYHQLSPTDITGDGIPEYLGYFPLQPESIELDSLGTVHVRQLAIAGLVKGKPKVLLQISSQGLVNHADEQLLPQVVSEYGYGFRLVYNEATATLLVTLLDANRQPASDELALSWDSKTRQLLPIE